MIEWSSIKSGKCIGGYDIDETVHIALDNADCQKFCEKILQCKSVDFQPDTRKCFRNSVKSGLEDCASTVWYSEWEYI